MKFRPHIPGRKFRKYLNDLPEEDELPENPIKNLISLILWSIVLVLLVVLVVVIVTWESGEPKELTPPPHTQSPAGKESEEVVSTTVTTETENANVEPEKTGLYYRMPNGTVYEGLKFGMWSGPSNHLTRDLQERYHNNVTWEVIGQRGNDYIVTPDSGDKSPEGDGYEVSRAYYVRYDGSELYENVYLMFLEDPINLQLYASEVFGMDSYMQIALPQELLNVTYSGTQPVGPRRVLRQVSPDIRIFAPQGSVTVGKVQEFVEYLREGKSFAKPFKLEVKSALMESTKEQGPALKTFHVATNGSIS